MPELPDICVYIDALERRIAGATLTELKLISPFFLRSVEPAPESLLNRRVTGIRRIGKRLAIGLQDELWLVMHLMIAGRLQWSDTANERRPSRQALALLRFTSGELTVTEAGTRKRASLHIVQGADALATHDPGGLEVLECDYEAFAARLRSENRTLKRALTDPRLLSGIGNAYSDEILHASRLSPVTLTSRLDDDAMRRLYDSTRLTLKTWLARLATDAEQAFPKKVTAFRPEMAVHGRYRQPCPVCQTPIQRIRYADNETNYCPRCQTDGRLLADRALSRLLKKDWPRSIEELEKLKPGGQGD